MTYEQYEHQQEQWAREWWERNGAVVMDLARLLEEARAIAAYHTLSGVLVLGSAQCQMPAARSAATHASEQYHARSSDARLPAAISTRPRASYTACRCLSNHCRAASAPPRASRTGTRT